MHIEDKLDLMLETMNRMGDKIDMFLPSLEDEKGVIHFLEITKNTFNTYLKNGTLIEGIHYIRNERTHVFVPDEIIKLKKSGVKGKRKTSSKQDRLDAVNLQLGIIAECRSAG